MTETPDFWDLPESDGYATPKPVLVETPYVRRVYSLAPVDLLNGGKPNPTPEYAKAQFDLWLESHDVEVRTAGYQSGVEWASQYAKKSGFAAKLDPESAMTAQSDREAAIEARANAAVKAAVTNLNISGWPSGGYELAIAYDALLAELRAARSTIEQARNATIAWRTSEEVIPAVFDILDGAARSPIEEIAALHVKVTDETGVRGRGERHMCRECGGNWPCDTTDALVGLTRSTPTPVRVSHVSPEGEFGYLEVTPTPVQLIGTTEQLVYDIIERVVVRRYGVDAIGLSSAITDALLASPLFAPVTPKLDPEATA